MTVWVLRRAFDTLGRLSPYRWAELIAALRLEPAELARWKRVSRGVFVPFHDDGVISQFEGYERLIELDWDGYRRRYGDIRRLDRVLEAEGDDINRYRAAKQADVLVLFYLFSDDELRDVLRMRLPLRCGEHPAYG